MSNKRFLDVFDYLDLFKRRVRWRSGDEGISPSAATRPVGFERHPAAARPRRDRLRREALEAQKRRRASPRYWALYLVCAVGLGLFWLEATAPFSETGHIMVEIGLLAVISGVVISWLRASAVAIALEGREKDAEDGESRSVR